MKKEEPITRFGRRILTSVALLFALSCAAIASEKPEVSVVDGHLGTCSADFTVMDYEQKPIYDAKINVVIRYGFLGLRRMELEVGTNSEGKARVAGLPERPKNPLKFYIAAGRLSKTVLHDPSAKCDASIEVNLETR